MVKKKQDIICVTPVAKLLMHIIRAMEEEGQSFKQVMSTWIDSNSGEASLRCAQAVIEMIEMIEERGIYSDNFRWYGGQSYRYVISRLSGDNELEKLLAEIASWMKSGFRLNDAADQLVSEEFSHAWRVVVWEIMIGFKQKVSGEESNNLPEDPKIVMMGGVEERARTHNLREFLK